MSAKPLIVPIACVLIAGRLYAGDSEPCLAHEDSNTARTAVTLKSRTPAQKFYFRLGHFVAFLSAHDLQAQLQSQLSLTQLDLDASLARDIAKDVVANDKVDLLKYAIANPKYLPRIEFLMARSLDDGVISLIDIWGRPRAENVLVVTKLSYKGPGLAKRSYCTADKELILDVTDMVE